MGFGRVPKVRIALFYAGVVLDSVAFNLRCKKSGCYNVTYVVCGIVALISLGFLLFEATRS